MSVQQTVDLTKVQYAKYFYQNQFGDRLRLKPKKPTSHAVAFNPDAICVGSKLRPPETMMEYAKHHNLLDVWKPILLLQFASNHSLRYAGDKAERIWKEFNRRIFKKK